MIISRYDDVTIRDFQEEDIPLKVEWINNPLNNKYLHYDIPLQLNKTIMWFRNRNVNNRIDCVIEYSEKPVGIIGLLAIDRINSKAEYYITVGDAEFKGKGIATKATKAILIYAFQKLNLHKIYLNVDADNTIARHLYEKCGFVQEGYFSDDLYRNSENRFIDRVRYSIFEQNIKEL